MGQMHWAVLTVSNPKQKSLHVFFLENSSYCSIILCVIIHYLWCFHPYCLSLKPDEFHIRGASFLVLSFWCLQVTSTRWVLSLSVSLSHLHTHTLMRAVLSCWEHDPDQGQRDHGNTVYEVCVCVCAWVYLPLKTWTWSCFTKVAHYWWIGSTRHTSLWLDKHWFVEHGETKAACLNTRRDKALWLNHSLETALHQFDEHDSLLGRV